MFSQEIADHICNELVEGRSLRAILKDEGMPASSTVFKYLSLNPEFAEQYARARIAQADTLADEILEIADDSTADTFMTEDGVEKTDHEVVARSRLRVDARKWLAAKMAPKKYGDKVETTLQGPDGAPVQIQTITRKIVDPNK